MGSKCLGAEERQILDWIGWKDAVSGSAVIRYLKRLQKEWMGDEAVPGIGAAADSELALWMARGCLALGDYEHCHMAVRWLEWAGAVGVDRGEWNLLMARGTLYCGRPEAALRYVEEGLKDIPEDRDGWYLAAELYSSLGDQEKALEAARQGRALGAGLAEFERLEEAVCAGESLEELEKARIMAGAARCGETGTAAESRRLEAVAGIRKDEEGLKAVKEVLKPEIWDADEPYCAFCFWPEGRELAGAFCMNEAAVSKWDPKALKEVVKELPRLEREGRTALAAEGELCLLEFYPDGTMGLIFETENGEKKAVISKELTVSAGPDEEDEGDLGRAAEEKLARAMEACGK